MITHDRSDGWQATGGLTQPGVRPGHSRMELMLAEIGTRLGLFEELAMHGPETCPELAARTGLDEGYIHEWLAVMADRAYLEYDAGTRRFALAWCRLSRSSPEQHDPPRHG